MIMTEDDALAEKIAVASLHGMDSDAWKRYDKTGSWFYEIHDTGFKYNLSDVHAAIGLAQLKKCDEFMPPPPKIARAYNEAFRRRSALQVPYASRASSTHGICMCCGCGRTALTDRSQSVCRAAARARHRHLGALHPA